MQSYFSNLVILEDFNVNFAASGYFNGYLTDFIPFISSRYSHIVNSLQLLIWFLHPTWITLLLALPACNDHIKLFVTTEYFHIGFTPTIQRHIWQQRHAHFERANDLLCDLDFDEILDSNDIQLSWIHFKTILLDIMEHCILSALLPNRRNLPWFNKVTIQLIRPINYHFHNANHSRSRTDHNMNKSFCCQDNSWIMSHSLQQLLFFIFDISSIIQQPLSY